MKKLNLLLIAIFFSSTLAVMAQETPSETPGWERATYTIGTLFEYEGEIVIDGLADESFWDEIDSQELRFDVSNAWEASGATDIDPELQSSGNYHLSWKTAMDEEFIYFFFEIIDDDLQSRSMHPGDNAWDNDNIEIFFFFDDDLDFSEEGGLTFASQLRIWVDLDEQTGDTLTAGGWASGILNGETRLDGDNYQPLGFKTKTVATDNGFNVEARIPWILIHETDLDYNLGYYDDDDQWVDANIKDDLTMFQFDIQGADRDADPPGERHFMGSWSGNWNRPWQSTQGYGVYTVGEEIVLTNVASLSKNSIKMYPNPARNVLNVENLEGITHVSIKNLIGQEVYKTTTNDARITLDINDLRTGVYLISITDDKGSRMVDKFVKK